MHGPMRSRMAAVISLVVVLPLLPPMATMGMANSARHVWPSCCSARSASATTTCGSACGTACPTTPCSTIAPMAPRAAVDLVVLVALARDQHDVPRLSCLEGRADGLAAVVDDARVARFDAINNGPGDG